MGNGKGYYLTKEMAVKKLEACTKEKKEKPAIHGK